MSNEKRVDLSGRLCEAKALIEREYGKTIQVIRKGQKSFSLEGSNPKEMQAWSALVEQAYKTLNQLLADLGVAETNLTNAKASKASKETKQASQSVTSVDCVMDVAKKSFEFYREAVTIVGVEEAVRRIRMCPEALTPKSEAANDAVRTDFALFTLPAAVVMFSLDWGLPCLLACRALALAAGFCIGGVVVYGYRKHFKDAQKGFLASQQQLKDAAATFFARWKKVSKKRKKTNIHTALVCLEQSQRSVDLVVRQLFPEVLHAAGLSDDCAICLERLGSGKGRKRRATSRPAGKDVMVPNCCTHLYHYECIAPWLEKKLLCPLCCRRCAALSAWTVVHTASP